MGASNCCGIALVSDTTLHHEVNLSRQHVHELKTILEDAGDCVIVAPGIPLCTSSHGKNNRWPIKTRIVPVPVLRKSRGVHCGRGRRFQPTGGFGHNLFIIAGLKSPLGGEKEATGDLVPSRPPVHLELHPAPEVLLMDLA